MYDRDYNRNVIQDERAVSTFSSRVYAWMTIGLGVTASICYFLYTTGIYKALMPFWWVWALGAFGVGMAISAALQRFSLQAVIALFLTYTVLEGILFGTLLPAFASAYGGGVIWAAFLTAAGIFGSAVVYGLVTKNDLTTLGRILSFGLMGLIGVSLIFMVLSFFIPMQWAHLFISYLGLILFVGLTAYDAQSIRRMSMQADIHSVLSYKLSMIMALRMYINVVMIFWYLLQIFSSSKRN